MMIYSLLGVLPLLFGISSVMVMPLFEYLVFPVMPFSGDQIIALLSPIFGAAYLRLWYEIGLKANSDKKTNKPLSIMFVPAFFTLLRFTAPSLKINTIYEGWICIIRTLFGYNLFPTLFIAEGYLLTFLCTVIVFYIGHKVNINIIYPYVFGLAIISGLYTLLSVTLSHIPLLFGVFCGLFFLDLLLLFYSFYKKGS